MKKHLLTLLALGSFCWANAQTMQATGDQLSNDKVLHRTVSQSKGLNCANDTVFYGLAKASGLSTIGINTATSAGAVCQYFDCPQSMNISGASFFAWKPDETGGISTNVQLQVYLAGPDSLPTGSPLASVDVAVDTTFGGGSLVVIERFGNFSPVNVSQPYCMVVSNQSTIGITMAMSSYTAGDGAGEWLGGALIGTTWLNGYDITLGPGTVFDADVLIQPIVSYGMSAGFSLVGTTCVPEDGAAAWVNESDDINFNKMYSVATFAGAPEDQFSWDYGDGSTLDNVVDGAHTYTGAPSWTVTLTDSLFGWSSTCVDTYSESTGEPVSGVDMAIPGNGSGSQTFNFLGNASGTNITSWDWDFGDGNTSDQQDPTHTYTVPASYSVCLTVTNDCGSDTYCGTANANTVTGIADVIKQNLSVYPNPSEGLVNLILNGVETDATISVLDVSGRVVFTEAVTIGATFTRSIDLDVTPGAYILRIDTPEGQVSKKLSIQ